MKNVISFIVAVLVLFQTAAAVSVLKKGCVTYSEGDRDGRTLSYRDITNGELGPVKTIVEKGEAGGDIQGTISFDGKWIAFARKRETPCPNQGRQWNGFGEDDYHKFHCWSIYVARLDGKLPTTPIKVSDEGYFPSWGDNSTEPAKTLYYGVWTKGEIWKATISNAGNIVSDITKHASVPDWESSDHHLQCSPNGNFVAIRYGGAMYAVGINGTTHKQFIGGGCQPSWFADSKWLYHAKRWIGNINGEMGRITGSGYDFGSSSNMKWAISVITPTNRNAANAYNKLKYADVIKTNSSLTVGNFDSPGGVRGTWPDIHEFEGVAATSFGFPNENAAPFSTSIISTQGGQLIVNTANPGMHNISLFDVNGTQRARVLRSHSPRTVISTNTIAEGMYILRVNFGERSTLKKLMIKK